MKKILALALLSTLGVAQAEAKTLLSAPLTLYVDPVNGNDSNACTSTGAGACKSFQGCYNNIVISYDVSALDTDFNGSVSGSVLTVTSVRSGALFVGQTILAEGSFAASAGVGLIPTKVVSFGTGSGGPGTYNLDSSQSFPANEMFAVAVTCLSAPNQSYYGTGGIVTYQSVLGQAQAASILMDGNGSTFTDTTGDYTGIFNIGSYAGSELTTGPRFGVRRMTLQSATTATVGLEASGGAIIVLDGMNFGAMPGGFHMLTEGGGSFIIVIYKAYTISGGAVSHLASIVGGDIVVQNDAVTLVGNPAFNYYALAQFEGLIFAGATTFSGGATGIKYLVQTGGVIDATGGPGLPGNAAGQCQGGYYNGGHC